VSEHVHYPVGERATYAVAGKAARQAHRRLRSMTSPKPSESDWRAFSAVRVWTTDYSKLDDYVSQRQLAEEAGLSSRQLRRTLRRLAETGVIVFQPGRGAGNLTVVGFPPEGMKAAEWQSALGLAPLPPVAAPKADKLRVRKSGHPRARALTEEPRREDLRLEGRLVLQTFTETPGLRAQNPVPGTERRAS
jgi:hypothetical protein